MERRLPNLSVLREQLNFRAPSLNFAAARDCGEVQAAGTV